MNKCKCVKIPTQVNGNTCFKLNSYYEFDYIPPVKDNPSYYRVFSLEDTLAQNFNIRDFKEYFKKF